MTDLFGRLFPALRDIRNPLAVGYTWLILVWVAGYKISNGSLQDQSAVQLYQDTTESFPSPALFSALTFLAVILGSGVVRLMDRVMQALRRNHSEYNPLDAGLNGIVREYILEHPALARPRQEWGGPEDSLMDDDQRLFLFYLQQDQQFGALESEQLLRFSLLPIATIAVALSALWMGNQPEWGVALLLVGLVVLLVVLVLDYLRTGSLLKERWRSLADEYPTWLPDEVIKRRETRYVRIRAILDTDSGLRSFSALDPGDPEQNQKRLAGLNNTVTELRTNGAPFLSRSLRRALPPSPESEVNPVAARTFTDLASRWNGVWQTPEDAERDV